MRTTVAVLDENRCVIIGILDKPPAFHDSGTPQESYTVCREMGQDDETLALLQYFKWFTPSIGWEGICSHIW